MAGVESEESGVSRSGEGVPSGQLCQSGEAITEWRSSEQEENGTPSTSPPYWDSDDDEDGAPKPSDLYGKYTWKIEKFSQINKRELRSNPFEVGGYKWYILIYPQGCDVCNHLSLFLCVANHDKLLPGWSHFAQFTIAVVNKDPKKSKYSDTLHRFWKKEHDWGWKKFMELSKVSDGFLDASDTLIIKAQVQVIREKADRPFRCLDCQYRRELVRVYLANIEANCRKFVEERRANLVKMIEDKNTWSSFCAFWLGLDRNARHLMSREKADIILKVVVKHFFVEKEVTSTLIMDSLYRGLKALEGQSKSRKGRVKVMDADEIPAPIVHVEKDLFVLVDDVLLLLQRAATEPLPPKDEKGPQNRTKDGNCGEDFSKDSIERDERRLTELGRRTVEIFVLTHIFNHKIEVSYQEAVALKRQEELIREEEAEGLAETEQKAKRGSTEKEKKSKKKQAKQKRNNRKGKEKGREEKSSVAIVDRRQEENPSCEAKESIEVEAAGTEAEKPDILEDISDLSDSVDGIPEALQPDSEDRDGSPVNWDTDASEAHPPTEASGSEVSATSSVPNGTAEKKSTSAMDDSSSTSSIDSVPSVVMNGHPNYQYEKSSAGRWKQKRGTAASNGSRPSEMENKPSMHVGEPNNVTESSKSGDESAVPALQHKTNVAAQHVVKKEGVVVQKKPTITDKLVEPERATREKPTAEPSSPVSPPQSPPKDLSSNIQVKSGTRSSGSGDPPQDRKSSSIHSQQNTGIHKPESQNTLPPKISGKSTLQSMPVMSRPSSAPLVPPGPRQIAPVVSMVQQQTTPALARSFSASGRLGPDPTQSYVPQSYRNAIIGNSIGLSSSGFAHSSSLSLQVQPPMSTSVSMLSDGVDANSGFPFAMVNRDLLQNGCQWTEVSQQDGARANLNDSSSSFPNFRSQDQSACSLTEEFPHLAIINDLLDDEQCIGKTTSSSVGSSRTTFHQSHPLCRQFSFPSEMSSGDLSSLPSSSSCRFERTMSYHNGVFQQGYGPSTSHFETPRDYVPQPRPLSCTNGQIASRWQVSASGTDLPLMGIGEGNGLNYYCPEFSNITSPGVNGYNAVFRPSNRH